MKRLSSLALVLVAGGLTACSGPSGLGGSSDYACPLPDGSTCKSMSQAYRDTYRDPKAASTITIDAASGSIAPDTHRRGTVPPPAEAGTPLLSGPRLMRILIAPWTDGDDHLMEERRVVVKLTDGQWRLDHFKASLSKAYGPKGAASASSPAPASSVPRTRPE